MKKISIVIPTYNRKEKLKYLLKTLIPQEQFLEEIDDLYEQIDLLKKENKKLKAEKKKLSDKKKRGSK